MNRVLLVGINPSGKPFRKGCSLDKMNAWMESLGFHHYSFSNVIPYEGEYKMQDVDAKFVSSFSNGYKKVIALGGFASRALSRSGVQHYVLPHPSPLNRKLNDREYEKRVIEECREWLAT
jgi:G:T/U-mismatch repair DNA glycosylase